MSVAQYLLASVKQTPTPQYIDDVFAATPYTGNGGSIVLTTGLDIAAKSGVVLIAAREYASPATMFETVRGVSKFMYINATNVGGTYAGYGVTAWGSTGITVTDTPAGSYGVNGSPGGSFSGPTGGHVAWTFCKAPKFFDVVTWVGNGVAGRTVAHGLTVAPGMIIGKSTTAVGDWHVYHRQEPAATYGWKLNGTAAVAITPVWNNTTPGAGSFAVADALNTNGQTYIAYIFAHDASADGLIQCGLAPMTGGASSISLGWEPQFLMMHSYGNSSTWWLYDASRGMGVGPVRGIRADGSQVEASNAAGSVQVTSTGFNLSGYGASDAQVYMAIRRSNKPVTTPSELFNVVNYTGNDSSNLVTVAGMKSIDTAIFYGRSQSVPHKLVTRAQGPGQFLMTYASSGENAVIPAGPHLDIPGAFRFTGSSTDMNTAASGPGVFCFRRAPGFHDVVHDMGTGAAHTIAHNLRVVPELIIRKTRSGNNNWAVLAGAPADYLMLNSTAAKTSDSTIWNSTAPTDSVFSVGTNAAVNTNTTTYTTLLFATLAGVSKVGSYTGNGGSQTINCGFAAGARFILIKSTVNTGDWFVWDTTNGIVAGNDPHLALNTQFVHVTTDDSVDPAATGFIVNQVAATNVNVNGNTYIYLAIA